MTDPLDLAWAAGLFDGEGTVNLYLNRTEGRHPTWQRQVSVGGTHHATIVHFAAIVGYPKRLYVRPPRKPEHREFYQWTVAGHQLDDTMEKLLPFLVTKREQAQLILKVGGLLERPRFTPVRPAVFAEVELLMFKLRSLNGNQKSGWVAPEGGDA